MIFIFLDFQKKNKKLKASALIQPAHVSVEETDQN